MLKKTIKYDDLDNNSRSDDFYFNFTMAELVDMEVEVEGGMKAKLEAIVNAQNVPAMMGIIKDIILRAYGKKSDDNQRFEKDAQIVANFYNSPAYSALFMELITVPGAAAEFVNGLMPRDLMEKVKGIQGAGSAPISAIERQPENYTLQERVDMSDADFDRLYGTDHRKWEKTTLVAAMRRQALSKKEV